MHNTDHELPHVSNCLCWCCDRTCSSAKSLSASAPWRGAWDWLREGRAQRHIDLVIKLLCNTTTIEQGSRDLLQLGEDDLEGFNMCVKLC